MDKKEIFKSIILKCFPSSLVQAMENINFGKIEEIRIRVNKPVILRTGQNEIILKYEIHQEEIISILQKFCNNSIYTYQNQICNRIHNNARWT